jgi:Uma2 family endonuclease
MTKKLSRKPGRARAIVASSNNGAPRVNGEDVTRARILEQTTQVRILDPDLCRDYIQQRQELGIDKYDEVWEGVYIVPPLANIPHQNLAAALVYIFYHVITTEGQGSVYGGANVSDRRFGWEHRFRAPDVVVVLKNSQAVDCNTHWMGGPDFLVEIQSPGDETEQKIPFYSQIKVRELLIIQRDTRQLRLYRHDGQQLIQVGPTSLQGGKWLVSTVVPLAFRRRGLRSGPRVEVQRTDGIAMHWTI